MDTITADEIMNDFDKRPLDNKIKEALALIAQRILLCDYDDAINDINKLVGIVNE
jgi:hypothetical protein